MTIKLNKYLLLITSFVTLSVTSCQKEELLDYDYVEGCTFTLISDNGVIGRSNTNELSNLDVKYFLVDGKGDAVDNRFVTYDDQRQVITIESIKPGKYELLTLAYSPQLLDEGFEVQSAISNKSDRWLHFTGDQIGLKEGRSILFGKISFQIENQPSIEATITLSNVMSAISFNIQTPSEYVKNSLSSTCISSTGYSVNNALSADGTLSGETPLVLDKAQILGSDILYSLPATNSSPVKFDISTETTNHEKLVYKAHFEGNTILKRGEKNIINIDMSDHPDTNNGMIFVTKQIQESEAIPKILQDDETKDVYYNGTLRSFNINEPLQIKFTNENKLHTRFYSPVPISNVSIWAKIPNVIEEILISFLDSIPAFCDGEYEMHLKDEMIFKTRNNQYITLTRDELSNLSEATLTIESNDVFWQKIMKIRAKWYIKFASYGGNPDLPNGGPAGNWMGIRPVHIRESTAILFNMAYLLTLIDYEAKLLTYQGQLYGNNGTGDIIDVKTIIPAMTNLNGFDVGLVYTGNGILGLGGQRTWGIAQHAFFGHYSDRYWSYIGIHELGHCMGYSHDSNMTYGLWANEITSGFYVTNLHRLPVNSSSYLNTWSNPNLYK